MPLPGNVNLIEVTSQFLFFTGVAASGTVKFRASGDPWLKDATADATLVPGDIPCTLDASGFLVGPVGAQGTGGKGVMLPATNDPDLNPNGFVYDVTVAITGLPELKYSIALPTGTTPVDLADLAPVTPVTGGGQQVVLQVNGKSPNGAGAIVLAAADVGALDQAAGDARYLRIATYNPQKAPVALSDTATIATDASASSLFRVTIAGNRTLGNPTGAFDGQRVMWEIKQDAVGGRTITLDSKFRLGSDITDVVLSAGANKLDVLGAQYHAADDVWRVIALAKGY